MNNSGSPKTARLAFDTSDNVATTATLANPAIKMLPQMVKTNPAKAVTTST